MLTKDNLNETLADAVMDRPREFYIRNIEIRFLSHRFILWSRRFQLWSPSLGMSMMLERLISNLGIDSMTLANNYSMAVMGMTDEIRKKICDILSIHSFRRFSDLSNKRKLDRRSVYFKKHLSDEELIQLLLIVLSEPRIETILSLSGIADEQKDQSRIAQIKNKDGHNRSFGGKTIYGLLIDAACKAYGWTKEYVVWGIDLISLRLMLADSVNSVYLSDEEAKQFGINAQKKDQIGMSADDFAKLREEFKD